MNKATLVDVLVYEAIQAGIKAELTKLREFYRAATAPGVFISCLHEWNCPLLFEKERRGPCDCGAAERKARLDKALAALAEDSEDGASEVGA